MIDADTVISRLEAAGCPRSVRRSISGIAPNPPALGKIMEWTKAGGMLSVVQDGGVLLVASDRCLVRPASDDAVARIVRAMFRTGVWDERDVAFVDFLDESVDAESVSTDYPKVLAILSLANEEDLPGVAQRIGWRSRKGLGTILSIETDAVLNFDSGKLQKRAQFSCAKFEV